MVNYSKLFKMFAKKGITTHTIRKYNLFGQEILRKFKMSSGTDDEIKNNLAEYKRQHGKDFKVDVSTKTIEDLCQILQCQPKDIIDWNVELNPELSFEKIKEFKDSADKK